MHCLCVCMLSFFLFLSECTALLFGSGSSPYPTVIASHPSEPNQIALGMSDGAVHVIEPSDVEPKWGTPLPQENGALSLPLNPSLSNPASEPASR